MQKQKFDEIVSYFNKKVSEMEIETKYKMELLGMVTALGYAHEKETHDKRVGTHACDLIERREAIDAVSTMFAPTPTQMDMVEDCLEIIENLPSAQPDLSEYSDKLWRNAYERGKRDAQPEPIRCKDCKHYKFADNRAFGFPVKRCEWTGFEDIDDNDFCSRAERREE